MHKVNICVGNNNIIIYYIYIVTCSCFWLYNQFVCCFFFFVFFSYPSNRQVYYNKCVFFMFSQILFLLIWRRILYLYIILLHWCYAVTSNTRTFLSCRGKIRDTFHQQFCVYKLLYFHNNLYMLVFFFLYIIKIFLLVYRIRKYDIYMHTIGVYFIIQYTIPIR